MIKLDVSMSFKPGDEPKLPIECPKCGKASEHRLSELKDGTEIACTGCGETIRISGNGFKTAGESLKNIFK